VPGRLLGAAILGIATLAIWAAPAAATFHLMQIREIYPGSAASPSSEYVELQMWAEDQNHVAGHVLVSYDSAGAISGSSAFPTDVPRGADQSTLVLATPEAESQLGIVADAPLAPSGRLDPAGGAVCWESIDCVSWGSFSGSLPSPAGAPASPAGIPDGMALRRSIAPGCATLLELADDHDQSLADFAPVFPGPRPNSVVPGEHGCERAAAGGGGGGTASAPGHGAPETSLRQAPPRPSPDRTPTFRFGADEAGASFECRLDRGPFRPCRSPFTSRRLALGRHVFQVRSRDDEGEVDPSPARCAFRVLPRS
jgi:hypothetical protein